MLNTGMEKIQRLPDEQVAVVDWLRSEQGEAWSRARIGFFGRILGHGHQVYLAELIPQSKPGIAARWHPGLEPADGPADGGRV